MIVGKYLLFSCSQRTIGPILRVGKDDAGDDVIDVHVPDINDFLIFNSFGEHEGSLTMVETCAGGRKVPVVFRDLRFKKSDHTSGYYELCVPEGLCYRCSQSCELVDEPRE